MGFTYVGAAEITYVVHNCLSVVDFAYFNVTLRVILLQFFVAFTKTFLGFLAIFPLLSLEL